MRYRRLGRTALQVSELCLGTMNFGPETPEAESRAIMDRALELGINFFDTANRYGGAMGAGTTEEILGRWFALGGGRREKVVLATKLYGAMSEWPNDGRLSARHIRAAGERAAPHADRSHRPVSDAKRDRTAPWTRSGRRGPWEQGKIIYVAAATRWLAHRQQRRAKASGAGYGQ